MQALRALRSTHMVSFSLFQDDPFYRLLSKVKLTTEDGKPKLAFTILIVLLVTWGVPLLLAAFQGVALSRPAFSYLYDFAAYAQFLVSIPLLFIAEPYIDREIQWGINHIYLSKLLAKESFHDFEIKVNVARKAENSVAIYTLALAIALTAGFLYGYGEFTNGVANWHSLIPANYVKGQFEDPTLAGWWNALVSLPVLVFLYLRWFWKVLIWYWLIWQLSRQKLQLYATHPDQVGGLGFLSRIQSSFALLILSVGISVAATNAYKLTIEKEVFTIFSMTGLGAILYFLVAPLLFLVPLLFFSSALAEIKRQSLLKYSAMATMYTRRIEEDLDAADKRMASYDIVGMKTAELAEVRKFEKKNSLETREAMQNLASVTDYYARINKMRIVPLDLSRTSRLFISGLVPFLTLLTDDLYKLIIKWLTSPH